MAAETTQAPLAELLRNHERFPALFHGIDRPTALCDLAGNLVAANSAALVRLGHPFEELAGRRFEAFIEPAATPGLRRAFVRACRGRSSRIVVRLLGVAGDEVVLEATLVPALVEGAIAGVYASGEEAIGRDVTAPRDLERSAREQTERIRELCFVAASAGENAHAQIASALDLGCRRLGATGAYLARIEGERIVYVRGIGDAAPLEGHSRGLDHSRERAILRSAQPVSGFDGGAYIGTSLVISGARGGAVTFLSPAGRAPFTAPDYDFTRLIGTVVASAVERDERARNLDALAFSDALTGLPNRLVLRDRLAATIAEAERDGFGFALHFYDLDGFKRINDRHGHLRGDEVLKAVARRMATVSQADHTLARIGGDEFVVLQPRVRDRAEAARTAHRFCDAVGEPFRIDGFEHRLSLSAGIAFYPQDACDADALLERADAALYRVKSRGRNAIAFADGRAV